MWKRLMDLFQQQGGQSERSVIHQRLRRRAPKIVFKMEGPGELPPAVQTSTGLSAVPSSQLNDYWKDRAQAASVSRFTQDTPQLREAMSTSENLLQPGSAEIFDLIRQHPVDELKARREREAELRLSQSGRFFRKPVKAQRIA